MRIGYTMSVGLYGFGIMERNSCLSGSFPDNDPDTMTSGLQYLCFHGILDIPIGVIDHFAILSVGFL